LISFDPNENLLRKINIENGKYCQFLYHKIYKKTYFIEFISALGDLKKMKNHSQNQGIRDATLATIFQNMALRWKFGADNKKELETVILNPGTCGTGFFGEQGSGDTFQASTWIVIFYTKGVTGFIAVPDVVQLLGN
jgi:hypothetical protein